jgi:hypothetical protein
VGVVLRVRDECEIAWLGVLDASHPMNLDRAVPIQLASQAIRQLSQLH